MDAATQKRIQLIHPVLREELGAIYNEIVSTLTGRAICRFTRTLSSYAEQDEIFAQGRTKPGKIVTKARGGQSYHNFALAADICLLLDRDGDGKFNEASWDTDHDFDGDGEADWQEVVAIFKRYGWEWGGDWHFKDTPHFQKTFGVSVNTLAYNLLHGKVLPGTNYPLITPTAV